MTQVDQRESACELTDLLGPEAFLEAEKTTPLIAASRSKWTLSGNEPSRSRVCSGFPCQAMPTFRPARTPAVLASGRRARRRGGGRGSEREWLPPFDYRGT